MPDLGVVMRYFKSSLILGVTDLPLPLIFGVLESVKPDKINVNGNQSVTSKSTVITVGIRERRWS